MQFSTYRHSLTHAVVTLQKVRHKLELSIPVINYVYMCVCVCKLNFQESEVWIWPFSNFFIIFLLSCKSVVFPLWPGPPLCHWGISQSWWSECHLKQHNNTAYQISVRSLNVSTSGYVSALGYYYSSANFVSLHLHCCKEKCGTPFENVIISII